MVSAQTLNLKLEFPGVVEADLPAGIDLFHQANDFLPAAARAYFFLQGLELLEVDRLAALFPAGFDQDGDMIPL
jgi:hypothetical protein